MVQTTEEKKSKRKAYNNSHKDEQKACRDSHRDAKKAKWKAYYESHKDEIKTKGKAYRDSHKKELKIYFKNYRVENKEKSRSRNLLKYYNITIEQYQQMILDQDNKCKICEQPFAKTPCVDHNHETGEVRGILCNGCNIRVGSMESELREATLKYIHNDGNI